MFKKKAPPANPQNNQQNSSESNAEKKVDPKDQPAKQPPEKVATQTASAAFVNQHLALYQNNQSLKKQINLLILLLVILSLVFGLLLWSFLYQYPKYRYIVTTNNSEICQVATKDKPNITPAALENFAQEAILDVNRYDYVNFEEQVQKALNRFFSANGRASYFQSLAISGNFDKVKNSKLISKAVALRSAQIELEEYRFGRYEWQISIPIKIEFYVGTSDIGQQSQLTQDFLATMTVVQETATRVNPKGVAVDAIVLKPM